MKIHIHYRFLLILLMMVSYVVHAQDAEKNTLLLGLKYNNHNNQEQYLHAQVKSKINGKFQMIEGIKLKCYISDETVDANLIGQAITNGKGEATILIPASVQDVWKSSPSQTFIITSGKTIEYDASRSDLTITKAKIKIDTAEGRIINANILALVDSVWTPVKDADMFVGVKRLGGNLNVNETETYPIDSLGAVAAEFKLEAIPGDKNGNIVLIAGVYENDSYGTVTAEMSVPWGEKTVYVSNYDERSLFARRGKSPLWLELMAYSIVAGVWGVLIYLIIQIRKIIKLGVE